MKESRILNIRGLSRNLASKGALLIAALVLISASPKTLHAQGYRYDPEHRRPLDATIHHLEEIAEHNTYSGKERERYDHALRHVSQFATRLHEGRFDKDKLDEAIGDVQNVIDNNPMGERARRVLLRDVSELRRLRENYDRGYRYPY
jgi:hypothetical protein